MSKVIDKNVEFIDKNKIAFISGCNLVCYDFSTKKSKFLLRENYSFTITSMSVGFKTKDEPYICLGEYDDLNKLAYVTVMNVNNSANQYHLPSKDPEWKIIFSCLLNNSPYCISISKREKDTQSQGLPWSKISFYKYTSEKFISQENLQENLIYCSYNPKNPLEIVICGHGYLRLWNVFINEGTLKEHPQRFLRGKQEKESTFLKAQFFDKKPFMLIVGTKENMFYIIEGFQVIYELNACYGRENIADMNIQNLLSQRDDDDISEIRSTLESSNNAELEKQLKKLTSLNPQMMVSQGKDMGEGMSRNQSESVNETDRKSNAKSDVFIRLYKTKRELEKEEENGKIYKDNPLRTFYLISDSLLLVCFENDGITLIYKFEKGKGKKPEKETSSDKNEQQKELAITSDVDSKKLSMINCQIFRLATNINSIVNVSLNSDKTEMIYLVEVYNLDQVKNLTDRKALGCDVNSNNLSSCTSLCLYRLLRKNVTDIDFKEESFSGYFNFNYIKSFDINEKKMIIYMITHDNWLRCFNYASNSFFLNHYFNDKPMVISTCPSNNLFAVSFAKKLIIYALLKNTIQMFCEFAVIDPCAKWSSKGDMIAVSGESLASPACVGKKGYYNIYFIDAFTFNTVNVIENITQKIVQIQFIDNDKYIFAMLDNSSILGWVIDMSVCSYNLIARLKECDKFVGEYTFKLFITHSAKGAEYSHFDYDPKNDLLLVTYKNISKMSVISNNKNGKGVVYNIERQNLNLPKIVKIVSDLKFVLCGTEDGSIKMLKWPFEINDNEISIENHTLTEVNLHGNSVNNMLLTRNFRHIITSASDGSIVFSNLLMINQENKFIEYDYFLKDLKPNFEEIIKQSEIYEYKIVDIRKKDENVEILDRAFNKLKQTMQADKDEILNEHNTELENIKAQLEEAENEEEKKYFGIKRELQEFQINIENDLENRIAAHEKDKVRLESKYKEKIDLYDNEIDRLKKELEDLKSSIEERFTGAIDNQQIFFLDVYNDFSEKFAKLREQIEESLRTLVKYSAEYDEATDTIVSDYEKLIKEMDEKMKATFEANSVEIETLKKDLEGGKSTELNHKTNLDQKVIESDKIIQRNAQIKQNIIDTTQRTITFQEQLLETQKNLQKIDKKLEDLVVKNKYLEQIRFVLEHRMTSLEKEKAPLEGQCSFLEKKKNQLQDEFNRLILAINLSNQELENWQSQLRASLIQNFEINDQKNYMEKKLLHLKNEIKNFILMYQTADELKTFQESKATKVALNLKQFYDKYFSTPINEELANYQHYSQKLQEETEKSGIANNFDLIMRDKAEEKLICEQEKLKQLKDVKEKGFKRMQNENTVLIAECNRLRKNLHEVYMHVVDIEQKFENLTKINPNLSKNEIVRQIKEFIKQTHNKIKSNFKENEIVDESSLDSTSHKMSNINQSIPHNNPSLGRGIDDKDSNAGGNSYSINKDEIFKSIEDNDGIKTRNPEVSRFQTKIVDTNVTKVEEKNDYENFIKLPEIKKKNVSFLNKDKDKDKDLAKDEENNFPKIKIDG